MHYKLMVMFIASLNIYILAMFNMSMIKGSIFTIGIIFGTCEIFGMFFGDWIVQYIPDHLAVIFIIVLGGVTCTIVKMASIS